MKISFEKKVLYDILVKFTTTMAFNMIGNALLFTQVMAQAENFKKYSD